MKVFYVLYNKTHINITNSMDIALKSMVKGYKLYAYSDNKEEALELATELNYSEK